MTYGICVPLLDESWSVYNRKTIKYNLKGETDNYIIKREEEKVRRVKEYEKDMAERLAERKKKIDEAEAIRNAELKAQAEQLAEQQQKIDEAATAPTNKAEDEEELVDVEVDEFHHDGKKYYLGDDNVLYDQNTHELVGRWNKETQQVVIM
jgi:hypothetical protein